MPASTKAPLTKEFVSTESAHVIVPLYPIASGVRAMAYARPQVVAGGWKKQERATSCFLRYSVTGVQPSEGAMVRGYPLAGAIFFSRPTK